MKHTFAILIALVLLALSASAVLADGVSMASGLTTFVNNPDPTDRLNLRADPSADAISLGKYYNGTTVTLLEEPKNGWAHVRIDPFEGYMDVNYLTQDYDKVTFASLRLTVANPGGTGANVRSQPSMDADVLFTYRNGDEVYNVLGIRDDGWLHIYVSGFNGFIRAELLTPTLSYHKSEQSSTGSVGTPSTGNIAIVNNPNPLDRLNLREAPNGNAAVLAKYYNGTVVEKLSAEQNGWVQVCVGGVLTGYMQTQYLTSNGSTNVTSAMITAPIANSKGTGLTLRATPDTTARSLGLYKNGTEVTIMGVYGGSWVHVMVDGQMGFMLSSGFADQNGLTFEPRTAQ